MREMVALRRGQGKIKSDEYLSIGMFDPQMSLEDKKAFVGNTGSNRVNSRLSPPGQTTMRKFVRDKVMYCALLNSLDVATTQTQAVVHATRSFGSLAVLRNADDIAVFLKRDAAYPLFCKPCEGLQSVGSALIDACDGDVLRLRNGRSVELADFSQELLNDYPDGFIFQTAIQQNAALQRVIGQNVGTLRVVTLRDQNGATPLYAVWKLPAPSAMSDNFWQDGSMVAEIDENGTVTRCKRGTGLAAEWIETHPVTGEALVGFKLPLWDEVLHLVTETHMLFPEFGVFGWDIAISDDGPLVVECNVNPSHLLYQLATGRGVLNAAFSERIEAAAKLSEHIGATHNQLARDRARDRKHDS